MSIYFIIKCKNFYKTRIKKDGKEIKKKPPNKLTAFIDMSKVNQSILGSRHRNL